jgi:ABC-type transport system substrate-binding protein
MSAQAPVERMHDYGVGDCLFKCNFEGNYEVPMIAEKYTLAPDVSYVDITIRKGIEFHKGWGEETAEDWVLTFNDSNSRVNPTSIHGQAGDFAAYIGKAELVDRYTFRLPFVQYSVVWLPFLMSDCHQSTTAMSKKAYDTKGVDWMRENMIGDGPFQVVEWVRNDRAYMENAPGTHWRREPLYQRLEVLEVKEEVTKVAMLKTGEVDGVDPTMASSIELSKIGFTIDNPSKKVTVLTVVFHGNYWDETYRIGDKAGQPLPREGYCVHDIPWVGCNMGCPGEDYASSKCKDPGDMEEARNVRLAMAMAIDRAAINEAILGGLGAPAGAWESLNVNAWYYDAKRWGIPYDVTKAKEAMAKTAWKEGNIEPTMWCGGEAGTTNYEVADAVAGMWKKAWPRMTVEVIKPAYAIIRPSLVGRTISFLGHTNGDEDGNHPFDWPHCIASTSLTRGGFGIGIEIPKIAETYLAVGKEKDVAKRIEMNKALMDYLAYWMIEAGTVQVPQPVAYNPKKIKSWPGHPAMELGLFLNMEYIVPVD